VTDSMVVRGEI